MSEPKNFGGRIWRYTSGGAATFVRELPKGAALRALMPMEPDAPTLNAMSLPDIALYFEVTNPSRNEAPVKRTFVVAKVNEPIERINQLTYLGHLEVKLPTGTRIYFVYEAPYTAG